MRSVHGLQIGLRIPDAVSCAQTVDLLADQSLSNRTTMSAVTKLMPRPPALVVSRNTNFSEPGALYSSMALIRSSCAVLPSIRQYSTPVS